MSDPGRKAVEELAFDISSRIARAREEGIEDTLRALGWLSPQEREELEGRYESAIRSLGEVRFELRRLRRSVELMKKAPLR